MDQKKLTLNVYITVLLQFLSRIFFLRNPSKLVDADVSASLYMLVPSEGCGFRVPLFLARPVFLSLQSSCSPFTTLSCCQLQCKTLALNTLHHRLVLHCYRHPRPLPDPHPHPLRFVRLQPFRYPTACCQTIYARFTLPHSKPLKYPNRLTYILLRALLKHILIFQKMIAGSTSSSKAFFSFIPTCQAPPTQLLSISLPTPSILSTRNVTAGIGLLPIPRPISHTNRPRTTLLRNCHLQIWSAIPVSVQI